MVDTTHIYADVEIVGFKGVKKLTGMLIDTGATFTVLPTDIIDEVGAPEIPIEPVEVELGDGKRVKAKLYAIGLRLANRRCGTIAVSFESAKPVIGVRTLEDLGLKPNPTTGELEEERPPGVAYYYLIVFSFEDRLTKPFLGRRHVLVESTRDS